MSEFSDMLSAGQADLEAHAGSSFTVSGVVGTFTGLLDVTTVRSVYSTSGMAPDDSARLTFSRSVSYVPQSGDVLTCGGVDWRVVSVRRGPVEYDVELSGIEQ